MIAFKKYLKRLRNITRPAWSRRCAERQSPDQWEPATWNPSLPGVFWSLFIGAPALWCDPNAWRDQRLFPIWSSEPHAIEMVARMRPGPWKTSAPQVFAFEKFHAQMWIHSGGSSNRPRASPCSCSPLVLRKSPWDSSRSPCKICAAEKSHEKPRWHNLKKGNYQCEYIVFLNVKANYPYSMCWLSWFLHSGSVDLVAVCLAKVISAESDSLRRLVDRVELCTICFGQRNTILYMTLTHLYFYICNHILVKHDQTA